MDKKHEGITCDVCKQRNIVGTRYACLACNDYDLCEKCFKSRKCRSNKLNQEHRSYHPMQAVLCIEDILESLSLNAVDESTKFCCPYCDEKELIGDGLISHCRQFHIRGGFPVRCPICLVYKRRHIKLLTTTLVEHIISDHPGYRGAALPTQNSGECPICMEEMVMGTRHLECAHKFHNSCILTWLRNNSSCPVCRTEIDQEE